MKCCICGREFNGYGNNPFPIDKDVDARCCDECNEARVIPARLKELSKEISTEK